MKELEIGETLTIRCVENKDNGNPCNGCFFAGGCENIPCFASIRKDGKSVRFEIVPDSEVGSTELIRMAHEDFDMLKEKGKEGEWALHYNGYLDGYARGFVNGRRFAERDIEPMVGAAAKEAVRVTIDKAVSILRDTGYFKQLSEDEGLSEEVFVEQFKQSILTKED